MQTTYDELILLYDRQAVLKKKAISIWVLHHVSVAQITKDEFRVLEKGSRSRYLTAVARLGVRWNGRVTPICKSGYCCWQESWRE